MRAIEYLVEVTVSVDRSEVDTVEDQIAKECEIRDAIQNLDPSIGVFQVERIQR